MKKILVVCLLFATVSSFGQKSKNKAKQAAANAAILGDLDKRLSMAETTFDDYRKENTEQNKISKSMALGGTSAVPSAAYIKPLLVHITHDVTVSIIFPSKIKTIDRGVDLIQSKKADGVENVLKIKAEKPFDRPSNLTVITEDGQIYVYTIVYEVFTTGYAIDMNKINAANNDTSKAVYKEDKSLEPNKVKFEGTGMNSEQISQLSAKVLASKISVVDSETDYNVSLIVKSIFVQDDIIFFPIQIGNKGDLNYDIELVKFFAEDKKEVKRTVKQVLELQPVAIYNEASVVMRQGFKTQVFAFNKFTISKDKHFKIVLYEKNGGRNVTCKISYKDIINAKYIEI